MCRMLFAMGNVDMGSVIDGLILMAKDNNQYHELNKKGKGTYKHEDGWGIAYLDKGKWRVITSIHPAEDDAELQQLKSVRTSMVLIHARKAFVGPKTHKNCQPFEYEDMVFCHNGWIKEPIQFDSKFKITGETDSEKFFYGILSHLDNSDDPQKLVDYLHQFKLYLALNFILVSQQKTIAAVKFTQTPEYYKMKLGRRNGLTVISSEIVPTIPNLNWSHMNDGEVVVIDNETHKYQLYSIDDDDDEEWE